MKEIAVYFAFARSGGTLINQLLGCEPTSLILSEVSPQRSVMPIEEQLRQWHGMISSEDAGDFGALSYIDKIDRIHALCEASGRRLCIRDWIVINFFPGIDPFTEPSYHPESLIYLQRAGYTVKHCAIVRKTDGLYKSLRQHIPYCSELTPETFAEIYMKYVRFVLSSGTPVFRLEDVQSSPRESTDAICAALNLKSPESIVDFHRYEFCTGNNSLPSKPASASAVSILRQKNDEPSTFPTFHEIDRLLGYE